MPQRHQDRVASVSAPNSAAVTPLAVSWRRSMVKHGLDPAQARAPQRVAAAALAERRARHDRLMQLAAPQMDQLFTLCPSGCSVLLTDAKGVVLDQRSEAGDEMVFARWGLVAGADWSEAAQGTNGIGTCLAEGRQVTIHRDEHFFAHNTAMSCIDAPIWGPDGRLAGALDVSSARADQTEKFNRLISAMTQQTARAIEAMLFRAAFPGARIVVGEDASVLLALDSDDIAIGATRAARRSFGLEREGAIRPRPAVDLLGRDEGATGFEKAERAAVIRALTRAGGNVSAAARALGVGRATLYRRMQRLGVKSGD